MKHFEASAQDGKDVMLLLVALMYHYWASC